MRILMQNRIDAFRIPGGDTIQMTRTKEYLERLGVQVDISVELAPNLTSYDVVHLFNLTRIHETYFQCMNAARANKCIVLSTIYQDLQEYESHGRYGLLRWVNRIFRSENAREWLKTVGRVWLRQQGFFAMRLQFGRNYRRLQQETLAHVTSVLPNSVLEYKQLQHNFQYGGKHTIVPNGVETFFKTAQAGPFQVKYGIKDFVLCVGHLTALKNQLGLLNALNDSSLPIVLVGKYNPAHHEYYQVMKKALDSRVTLLPRLEHPELASCYAAARVLAQPSWFETASLVGLEAALTGCNIVMTNRGYAREYFGESAWYCDPADLNSIRSAVLAAFHSPRRPALAEHIAENYSWERAAQKTLQAYEQALSDFNNR